MTDVASDLDFIRINTVAFEASPSEFIDYAVMEKTDDAVVVPLDAVGVILGLAFSMGCSSKDAAGNVAWVIQSCVTLRILS